MHEFSVAQSLIEAATAEAAEAGAVRVTRLYCRIGVLRQVDEWLLKEAFEVARQETVCETADLSIEMVYLQLACPRCEQTFSMRDWDWQCPRCGTEGIQPTGGDELELTSLEAEVSDEDRRSEKRVSEERERRRRESCPTR
ncbi:MAG: hydrogenase maturation nickel metallochaperone HypA [Phycisphaerales bacterium]|nr:hydrogenase maturation nickel metallochaperone HypA [Phycisphaerales bacterium]